MRRTLPLGRQRPGWLARGISAVARCRRPTRLTRLRLARWPGRSVTRRASVAIACTGVRSGTSGIVHWGCYSIMSHSDECAPGASGVPGAGSDVGPRLRRPYGRARDGSAYSRGPRPMSCRASVRGGAFVASRLPVPQGWLPGSGQGVRHVQPAHFRPAWPIWGLGAD